MSPTLLTIPECGLAIMLRLYHELSLNCDLCLALPACESHSVKTLDSPRTGLTPARGTEPQLGTQGAEKQRLTLSNSCVLVQVRLLTIYTVGTTKLSTTKERSYSCRNKV